MMQLGLCYSRIGVNIMRITLKDLECRVEHINELYDTQLCVKRLKGKTCLFNAGFLLYWGTPSKVDIALSIFIYGIKYEMIKEANSEVK